MTSRDAVVRIDVGTRSSYNAAMRRALLSFSVTAIVGLATLAACSSSDSGDATSSGGSSGSSGGSSGSSGSSGGDDDASTSGGLDSGTVPDAADAATQPFTLTSTALAEGAKFAAENTCTGNINTSPPFAWTAGPAGTLSYALVLTDKSNKLVHAVIYDIPAALTALPANVQKAYQPANVAGAKQPLAYDNTTRGYLGPCPGTLHTYEFALYAIDVATLPGATMATTRDEIVPIIMAHDLAVAKLTGTYVKP